MVGLPKVITYEEISCNSLFILLYWNVQGQNDTTIIFAKFNLLKELRRVRIPVIDPNEYQISFKMNRDSLICNIGPFMSPIREHSLDSVGVWQVVSLSRLNKIYIQKIGVPLNNINEIDYFVAKYKDVVSIKIFLLQKYIIKMTQLKVLLPVFMVFNTVFAQPYTKIDTIRPVDMVSNSIPILSTKEEIVHIL